MADEGSKPTPPPPPPPSAAPPPPAPPKPAAAPQPAAPRPSNTLPPKKRRPQGKKRRPAPKGRPQGKKRRPAPKGRPQGKKRGGRIKIKLGLRAKKMSEETDEYTDQIGWTTSGAETVLSDLKDIEEVTKKEPETLTHHCSMCGSRMQIPRPKRERYRVICAHPECGHEDRIGF